MLSHGVGDCAEKGEETSAQRRVEEERGETYEKKVAVDGLSEAHLVLLRSDHSRSAGLGSAACGEPNESIQSTRRGRGNTNVPRKVVSLTQLSMRLSQV